MDIDGFVSHLKEQDLSPNTIAAYRREAINFARFLKQQHLRATAVKPKHIAEYLKLFHAHAESGAARRRRLSALSTFFRYLQFTTDGRARNPVTVIRRPRRQPPKPKPVDDEVLEKLIAGITSLRDKAIIMLLFTSGLRLAELVSLNRNSIETEITEFPTGRQVLGIGRVIGKGNKEREFLVTFATLRVIHEYDQARGNDQDPAMFLSNRKRRISARAIEHMLHSWCRKLELPPIHPHRLRHSAGTTWYRLGLGMDNIQKLLGHSSRAITEQYIKPDLAQLRAEYFAAMEQFTAGETAPPSPPSSHK